MTFWNISSLGNKHQNNQIWLMFRKIIFVYLYICSKLPLSKRQCNYLIHHGICITSHYMLMLNWNKFILILRLNPYLSLQTYTKSWIKCDSSKTWLQIIRCIFSSKNLQSIRYSEVTRLLEWGIHQEQVTTVVGYVRRQIVHISAPGC